MCTCVNLHTPTHLLSSSSTALSATDVGYHRPPLISITCYSPHRSHIITIFSIYSIYASVYLEVLFFNLANHC